MTTIIRLLAPLLYSRHLFLVFYILHALLTLTRIFDCSLFRPYAE